MGWNSWDCYGTTVTEAEVLANAEFMAQNLLVHGWDTIVIDIDWSDPTARSHGYNADAPLAIDEHGRLIPDVGRFPSSADGAGFEPLARRLHELGLKLGIHTMRGIPRRAVAENTAILGTEARAADVAEASNVCEWNPDMLGLDHSHPATQAYYDSTLALYAAWGIDFIKCDDMLWPYQRADIEAYAEAIRRSGRDIRLSLSPGRDLSLARLDHLREYATMWRICDDLWDRWEDVEANFARFARWAPFASEHGWPDGDMLPLGRIGIRAERGVPRNDLLTPDERRTLMSLWVIARSPLMIGGDLPTSEPETIALFTNDDVLEVLSASSRNSELLREGGLVLWGADGPGSARFAAAFNVSDASLAVELDAENLGFVGDGTVRELWSGREIAVPSASPGPADASSGASGRVGPTAAPRHPSPRGVAPGSLPLAMELPPHGCALLRFDPVHR